MCPRCGGHAPKNESSEISEDMRREAERIARGLYDGTISAGEIDPKMVKLVAEELRMAVIKGFGKDLPDIHYGTPDYKMLSSLINNVFEFAGGKNYEELKAMSQALIDENGMLRSFKDFKTETLKISSEFQQSLKTEYNTAVSSAQMSSKWVEAEKNKAIAPWLRYDTVGDARVRDSHRLLDGIVKKVDDPFWDAWYPPNGWNCRCDATQLLHGAETPGNQITLPDDVPVIFKTNMAKGGYAFPSGHRFFEGMPPALKNKVLALRDPQYSQAYPADKPKTVKGGSLHISSMADEKDLAYNILHGTDLADFGEQVHIRPHIAHTKNPELELYNGSQIGDFKEPKPKSNFKTSYENNIKATAAQGGQIPVFVLNDTNYSSNQIVRALNNKKLWDKANGITEVWLLFEKKLVKITREEISLGSYVTKIP